MRALRAAGRLTLMALALLAGAMAILLTGWIPWHVRGVRLGAWPTRWLARVFLRLFAVQVAAPEAQTLVRHRGFVLCNHQSYLDIVLLVSLVPVRFLAKAEVRRYPVIGWIAWAVGTVFVDRRDRDSRLRARERLARARRYPPVVIFPEGGIATEPGLQPFRHGAFEIAARGETPILPCVIIYEPAPVARWGDESLPAALWRLARHPRPLQARLVVLPTLRPGPQDSPAELALRLHENMARILADHGA